MNTRKRDYIRVQTVSEGADRNINRVCIDKTINPINVGGVFH